MCLKWWRYDDCVCVVVWSVGGLCMCMIVLLVCVVGDGM